MTKLIVLPGNCAVLGGNAVSLSLMIKGFERCGASEQLCVLVQQSSLLEKYLQQAGQGFCLQLIDARDLRQFVKHAIKWVSQQPQNWPLLLENFTARQLMPSLMQVSPILRLSRRPVYHMFRDQALSFNPLGNLIRNFAFACLSPHVLCNSHFTAASIDGRLGRVQAVLYPPVDYSQFNSSPATNSPPEALLPILQSGARIMLTPSRISQPNQANDKNLRALISLIAQLKAAGHHYHGVVIGQDISPGQVQTQLLLKLAQENEVADRFTVLPPTFFIQEYYKYADIVVTLAPREPFGRTVIEAVTCSVPVVGSKTGGIGEILNKFAPEWAVDPNDLMSAAVTINYINTDPNTPAILSKGKRWIEENCNAKEYAYKMIEVTQINLA